MKRLTQCVCVFLIVAFFFNVTVLAAEDSEMRASDYFMSNSQYLYRTSSTSFDICFNVSAVRGMDQLGAEKVVLKESPDGVNWTEVKTYWSSDYPEMMDYGSGFHACSFSYDGKSGYHYKAAIRYYAKKDGGNAYFTDYTTVLIL